MHLLIVGEKTLPIHLEYNFVGVHKNNDCSWDNITISGNNENTQAYVYADFCGLHAGSEILLYLEKPKLDNIREGGRFIGIFEVVSPRLFYEPNGDYLKEELNRNLIYRLRIQPKIIYSQGVSEWQAIDEMTDFKSVLDIPWSIIYRKLVGGRGCTPLLPHEAEIMRKMLDMRNHGLIINHENLSFDFTTLSLVQNINESLEYKGNTEFFQDIGPRLIHLIQNTDRKWEPQLQAYLMQEIRRNDELTNQLFPNTNITWIGNEIYAGAGMQRIDILIYSENDLNKFIHLIELKAVEANSYTASQMNRYIKWIKSHIPNISINQIIPTVIAPSINNNYNTELKTFLRGHGITQYRNILVDQNLNFHQTIQTV